MVGFRSIRVSLTDMIERSAKLRVRVERAPLAPGPPPTLLQEMEVLAVGTSTRLLSVGICCLLHSWTLQLSVHRVLVAIAK